MAVQLLGRALDFPTCWLPFRPVLLPLCPPWLLVLAGTVVVRLQKYTSQRDEAQTSSSLHWHLFQRLTSPRPTHHVLKEHARQIGNIVLECLGVCIDTNIKLHKTVTLFYVPKCLGDKVLLSCMDTGDVYCE